MNRAGKRDAFADAVRGLSHADVIRAAIAARKNILIVGATGSGKTTLVNAILDELCRIAPNDRVISIEDTTELQCSVRKLRGPARCRQRFRCWIVFAPACD